MSRTERASRVVSLPAMPAIAALALLVLTGAACGGSTPIPPGGAGPSPSQPAPGSLGPPASLAPGATPLVRIDPALLAVLPGTVSGQSVLESSEGDADASTNASLALIADSAVGALAIDPGPGDFVLALVIRLKAGALDDAGFRNWRDAFDTGVCGGSGIAGHAQSQIGGRTVYVGTCGNGVHTYHAWIPDSRLLVSASSDPSSNFGQLLFSELKP